MKGRHILYPSLSSISLYYPRSRASLKYVLASEFPIFQLYRSKVSVIFCKCDGSKVWSSCKVSVEFSANILIRTFTTLNKSISAASFQNLARNLKFNLQEAHKSKTGQFLKKVFILSKKSLLMHPIKY